MSAIFLSNRQMILILHCTVIRPRKVLKQAPHAHRGTRTVLLQLDFQVLHKNAPEKGKPHFCCCWYRREVGTKSILLIIQQAKKGTPLAMEVSSKLYKWSLIKMSHFFDDCDNLFLRRRPRGGMDRASVCNFRNATDVGSNPVQDARIFHPQKPL